MDHTKIYEDSFYGKFKMESEVTSGNELNFRFHKNKLLILARLY